MRCNELGRGCRCARVSRVTLQLGGARRGLAKGRKSSISWAGDHGNDEPAWCSAHATRRRGDAHHRAAARAARGAFLALSSLLFACFLVSALEQMAQQRAIAELRADYDSILLAGEDA